MSLNKSKLINQFKKTVNDMGKDEEYHEKVKNKIDKFENEMNERSKSRRLLRNK